MKSFEITNYKSVAHLVVPNLSNLNIITGSGGSGKTSFLECVALINRPINVYYLSGTLIDIVNSVKPISDLDSKDFGVFSENLLDLFNDKDRSISIREIGPSTKFVKIDNKFRMNDLEPCIVCEMNGSSGPVTVSMYDLFSTIGKHYRVNHQQPNSPEVISVSSSQMDELDLAILYGRSVDNNTEESLIKMIKYIDRDFMDIKTLCVEQGTIVKLRLGSREKLVRFNNVGDRLRRIITLLCAVSGTSRGDIVLIDNIDNYINRSDFGKVWESIVALTKLRGCQVFATTSDTEFLKLVKMDADKDLNIIDLDILSEKEKKQM